MTKGLNEKDHKDKSTKRQKDKRTEAQKVKRAKGQKDKRTKGQKDGMAKEQQVTGTKRHSYLTANILKNIFEVMCRILGTYMFLFYIKTRPR